MSTRESLDSDRINLIQMQELLRKRKLEDTDIILLQDNENTKHIIFSDLRDSLISDGDNPSEHKLFSSYHITELMQNFDDTLKYELGRVFDSMNYIKEHYVTDNELEEAIEETLTKVPTVVDFEAIKKSLESKRDKSVTITCDDIESGVDEKKIQPRNLSYEVISMMVGTTPVDIAKVPQGGWVQEDIANGAINALKLAKQYRFRGHFPEGNINLFTDDGLFLVGATTKGLPVLEEDDEPEPRLLEVYNYGPDQNIIQRLYYIEDKGDETRPYFERKALLSRLAVTGWNKVYPITDKYKINRSMITDDFLNAGSPEDVKDVYDLKSDNNYLIKKGTKNLPNDQYDFVVSVRNYDDRIEYQAKSVTADRCEIFISHGYYMSNMGFSHTKWYNITSTSLSRLDGKRLHLFGDGICFGLGSTEFSTLSYPALLTSRYGLIINNHALGDATIGNYEDEVLSERSVIQQVSTAVLDDADMVIIWAGSNDYKTILSDIGENEDDNDHSFKGALNLSIQNIIKKNPNAKILIVSPIFRARLNADDIRNSDDTLIKNKTLWDFVTAMREVAEYNHIPFLDLYSNGMINRHNFTTYLKDRLYLNDNGHDMIADKIFNALNYYY